MIYTTEHETPVGSITLACDGESLTGLWLAGQKYFGGAGLDSAQTRPDLPVFEAARVWLADYFAGRQPSKGGLALAPAGSDFRKKVWQILCNIPYGGVTTYGAIAKELGCKSAQAVGGAVGHNPISIIIPCHRVVGAAGDLTGYAGGIEVKKQLLILEGAKINTPA